MRLFYAPFTTIAPGKQTVDTTTNVAMLFHSAIYSSSRLFGCTDRAGFSVETKSPSVSKMHLKIALSLVLCCILTTIHALRPAFVRYTSSGLRLHSSIYPSAEVKNVQVLHNGMKYRNIPQSELTVSEIGLGTMNFGDQLTKRSSLELLDHATKEYAINFIDTAESYPIPSAPSTSGKSEKIIGEWLRQHKSVATGSSSASSAAVSSSFRQNIVLSTKICGYSDEITWCREDGAATRLTKKQIIEAVDAQLARLGTDYIDLLQFHWPDRNQYVPLAGAPHVYTTTRTDATPIETQLEAIAELIKAGKIRSFGLSNETPYGITSFVRAAQHLSLPRPVSLQTTLNLLEGRNELDMGLAEACAPLNGNVALIACSPLAGGALTGKYLDMNSVPETARMRQYVGYMHRYVSEPATEAVRAYAAIATQYDLPLASIAAAWVYAHPAVCSTLIGASSLDQLRDNVQALNLVPLGDNLMKQIEKTHRTFVDPTKGVFPLVDPNSEYTDPSKLPWGAKDQDVDPELDILINQRLQN